MGYWLKAILGAVMVIGGLVLFNVNLVKLLETGTCASGNTPYQISRPCPSGTGTQILLLMVGIFGGLIGAAIFAFRGEPPWRDKPAPLSGGFGWGIFLWGVFFTSTALVCLWAAFLDSNVEANGGGKLGAMIVGATFLLMGVPALIMSAAGLFGAIKGRDDRPSRASAESGPAPASGVLEKMRSSLPSSPRSGGSWVPLRGGGGSRSSGGGDPLDKIERLKRLRDSGALSDAEFEAEKAKLLAQM